MSRPTSDRVKKFWIRSSSDSTPDVGAATDDLPSTAEEEGSDGTHEVISDVTNCFTYQGGQNENSTIEEDIMTENDNSRSNYKDDRQSRRRKGGSKSYMVGREEELRQLMECWERVSCQRGADSEVVLIHGESGTGKSSLVESLRLPVVNDSDGAFVSGKWDQTFSRKGPFRALIVALGDLCDILSVRENAAEIVDALFKALDRNEMEILLTLIPIEFQRLLVKGNTSPSNEVGGEGRGCEEDRSEQRSEPFLVLKRACRTFLDVGARFCSLAVFFDDTQWADEESIDLLQSVLRNSNSRNILFILSFREGYDVTEKTFLQRCELPSLTIPVSNLDIDQVNELACALVDVEECPSLGMVIYEKTKGNPLCIQELIRLLKMEELLVPSHDDSRWFLTSIEQVARLDVSQDVLSTVDALIGKLPSHHRLILSIAAHLGFVFDRSLLKCVIVEILPEETNCDESNALVDQVLSMAEDHGLAFTENDKNVICWMHDRVQEQLCDMIPDGEEKERLSLLIGRKIVSTTDTDEERGSFLFLAVDHLNHGEAQMTDEIERKKLVELNKRAAHKAGSLCSFVSAMSYLETAIGILGEFGMWTENYELSLHLHATAARFACNTGDFRKSSRYVQTVLYEARTVIDKQEALHARITAFNLEGMNQEALITSLEALQELGLRIHPTPSLPKVLWRIMVARNLLNRLSLDGLMLLQPTDDTNVIALQDMLRPVAMQAAISGNDKLMLLACVEIFILSLRHGRTNATPAATAAFGMIESFVFQSMDKGVLLCQTGMDMLEAFDYPESRAPTTFVASGTILPWRSSLQSCLSPLRRGIESGVQYGETYFGITLVATMAAYLLHCGKPLEQTEEQLSATCRRMAEYTGSNTVLLATLCYWQTVLNMLGRSECHPLLLDGEAMREVDILENPNESHCSAAMMTLRFCKLMLAYHYDQTDVAFYCLGELERDPGTFMGAAVNGVSIPFFATMIACDLARAGINRRRNRVKAIKSFQVLKRHATQECPFAKVLYRLLQGDIHVLRKGKVDTQLYDAGIKAAKDESFVNYAAVGCERVVLALVHQQGKAEGCYKDEAVAGYLNQGLLLNQVWEAHAKVEWFGRRYLSSSNDELSIEFSSIKG